MIPSVFIVSKSFFLQKFRILSIICIKYFAAFREEADETEQREQKDG